MDISRWIDRRADHRPDKTAIHFAGRDIRYAEFAERIAATARALKHDLGIGPGDRIAYLGYNRPEMLDLLFACARLGAMLTPLNWRLAPAEHEYILNDCGAAAVFAESEFREHLGSIRGNLGSTQFVSFDGGAAGWLDFKTLVTMRDSGADANPEAGYASPLLVVYTSGTTGRPKGAVLTQDAIFWNALNSIAAHDMSSRDHILTTLPMFHVGGLNIQTTPAFHAGATVTLHRRFDPETTLHDIVDRRPSLFLMVPATMSACLNHPDWSATDLSSLRMVAAGSSVVPEPLIRRFHDRGVPVIQVYGATETAPIAIVLTASEAKRKLGSSGKAALHCEIRIVDRNGNDVPHGTSGEILVRGRNVMQEYWSNREATAKALVDDWYHTGDMAHRDAEGFVFVDERKSDLIVSGGENIYPAELENVLLECPDIAEAAVVARKHDRWGQIPVAVVVAKAGGTMTREDILALFEGRLARFKHPREVVFVEALPRNAMGKVLRYELRDMLDNTDSTAP